MNVCKYKAGDKLIVINAGPGGDEYVIGEAVVVRSLDLTAPPRPQEGHFLNIVGKGCGMYESRFAPYCKEKALRELKETLAATKKQIEVLEGSLNG